MKPYGKARHFTKGLAGCRRSCDTPHRKRCLRVDKRAARQEAELKLEHEWKEMVEQNADYQLMNKYYETGNSIED